MQKYNFIANVKLLQENKYFYKYYRNLILSPEEEILMNGEPLTDRYMNMLHDKAISITKIKLSFEDFKKALKMLIKYKNKQNYYNS